MNDDSDIRKYLSVAKDQSQVRITDYPVLCAAKYFRMETGGN